MVEIKFNDGSSIKAEENGNNFITKNKPSFPNDLSKVEIKGEQEQILHNCFVQESFSEDGRYWFIFIEKSEADIERENLLKTIADQNNAIDELTIAILEG